MYPAIARRVKIGKLRRAVPAMHALLRYSRFNLERRFTAC